MKNHLRNALITGGAGFIGSHIADTLLAQGCQVTVLDNLSSGNFSNLSHIQDQITFYEGDIRDAQILTKAMNHCDIVFHQAAMVSVPQTVENPTDSAMINDIGTLLVLETARKHKVKRVVLASSSAVYGDDPQMPKHEHMNPKPLTPYAVQKLTGEYYARLYHELYQLETVCLRYFNVYGPRQDPSSPYSGVISIFMTKADTKTQPVIYGDGNQFRDFIFVKDVVQANLLAATTDNASGNIFNVGTGKSVSINQMWEMISRMADVRIDPRYEQARAGDIRESLADIRYIKDMLGFEPEYSLEKGIEITFDWYRKC